MAVPVLAAISFDMGVPGQELLSTLRFHIGAVLLLLPVLLAVAGGRWRALVMLGLVGLSLAQGVGIILEQQQRRVHLEIGVAQASFEGLSFNVLFENPRSADAAAFIIDSDADVVVVLEALGLAGHLEQLAAAYPYRLGCDTPSSCSIVIFSRTPLADTQMKPLRNFDRDRLLIASTVIDGRAITIAGLHLSKPYYDSLAGEEIWEVRKTIRDIEGPMLLAGDFNAAAWSNKIAVLADRMDLIPPPAYPATWPVEIAPLGLPLDNMFTRGPALIREIVPTSEAFGSNHLGLLARVDLF